MSREPSQSQRCGACLPGDDRRNVMVSREFTDPTTQNLRINSLPKDTEFALCLTHDVDRPFKGLRSLYYATQERPGYHLGTVLSSSNPYWQFEEIMALEDELGVRSAFYFLNEQHLLTDRPVREWLSPANWVQHLGRYDVTAEPIADIIREPVLFRLDKTTERLTIREVVVHRITNRSMLKESAYDVLNQP